MPKGIPSNAARRRRDHAALGIEVAGPGTPSMMPIDEQSGKGAYMINGLNRILLKKQELASNFTRLAFIEAAPLVAQRVIKMALGRLKGATPTNQLEAAKVVLQHAGIEAEKALRDGTKPLGEYTLTELEQHLASIQGKSQDIRAIPGESEPIPD